MEGRSSVQEEAGDFQMHSSPFDWSVLAGHLGQYGRHHTLQVQGLAALLNALADIVGGGGNRQESEATTFEGFTAEQWAIWGKRKSGIASTTSRLNGQLKTSITSLEGEVAKLWEKLQGSGKSPVLESSNCLMVLILRCFYW